MNITKGRWYAVENNYYVDIMVKGNPIAQVIENEFIGTDKDTMRANAKLMECAPEMCEMLNRWVNSVECVDDNYQDGLKEETMDLLAKARGES